jgi:hypothetical protein
MNVLSGQKLIKLVNKNTLDTTNRIIPNVPEIICVKNKMLITAAINNLIILSILPIFFFIIFILKVFM